jgi:Domain of unknown function (DUF927)
VLSRSRVIAHSTSYRSTRVRDFYERYNMSNKRISKSRHRGETTSARTHKIRKKWSVRILRRGSLTGPAFVEFRFPTQGGGLCELAIRYSDLRHTNTLLDQFSDYLPIFPADVGTASTAQCEFIRGLVSSAASSIVLLPDRTGFIDLDSFVTHSEIIHADGTRTACPRLIETETPAFADIKGTAEAARDLLKLARYSTYLAFGIGVAVAAPLPTYVKLARKQDESIPELVRETAVFNFSGKSSSGKSSVCLAAMSLAGSPDRAGTLDFSRRGLAEMASASNDLVMVMDDTEKAEEGDLVKALKAMIHMVPGGRSKIISKSADKFPILRWSTFGLASSPRAIATLAQENRWTLSPGDKVRLFDIAVPGPSKGGIFDRVEGPPKVRAKRSVMLIAELERGYVNNSGQIIPEWIIYLMASNRAKRIMDLADKFIRHVGARGQGWEFRFALKFGVVYAAMKMGIDAGILPWPTSLPLKVAIKCYRKARNAAKTTRERVSEAPIKLRRLLSQPGRVVDASVSRQSNEPIRVSKRTLAIRYGKGRRAKIGVFDAALSKSLGSSRSKTSFMKGLVAAGLVRNGHGHAGTSALAKQAHPPVGDGWRQIYTLSETSGKGAPTRLNTVPA